ncbi:phytoene desaturase family protein [Tabrizicola oligotrophica]|uniref:Pyridine nucleotide-disulfide oxidoreductase domain-containing protein 2 n=1 Tax=Tabrizicola oligotrophica TaxID=2710650 RepID=A0A6M0QPG3_9RHOB|nr:NAD(P)/FAD-dependent oxidoreductase [Tabrizicola oligotrophica]NEY89380.1 NAD(P)/FAD-dependent oxidoreductase [Tabrizicola oligotrophica]
MPDTFDAVLIGAGHNTLACALQLARKGWRVGVFEQAAVAGGAVKTGEYTLPGFRHDWAAMNLSLFAGSPFCKENAEELGQHGVEFVPVSRPFASAFPDGRWCGVSIDADETRARIAGFAPEDAETWQRLSAAFANEAPHLFGLLGSAMRIRALAYFVFKILRAKGLGCTLDMARFLMQSPRQWLDQSFVSPEVKAMLGAWGMHLDFAPDVAGGALFPYLEGMAGQAFGMALGRGGADTIIRAMVAAIRARGGVVEVNAPVARILQDGRRASGIELVGGRRILASRAVIAGVAPRALPRLTGGITPEFDRAMTGFTHAPGTMMIHLAMDGLPDWAAGAELQSFAYVHLAPSLDQMARTYQQAQAGLLPDEPILVVGQPTSFDPSRAPEGKHVLWLQVRMVPGTIRGDAKGEIAATDWDAAAGPMAERALDILERYAPGTRAKILGRRVVTPRDLEADNPNLVGGDQVCGSHHLAQHFLFRPVRGHADGSTPLQNLHLTGAGVWPGAGTGAGPGTLLARRLAR